MGSELDRQLNGIMARLTAPRSPFERARVERDGIAYEVFARAPRTLPDIFARSADQYRDQVMLVDAEQRLTFGEVHDLAARFAAGLAARHAVAPGCRVGIAAANSASWIVAYMGVLMAGGCATLLNAWWTGTELREGIAIAGCSLVIADPERGARITEATASCPVIVIDPGDPRTGLTEILAPAGAQAPAASIASEDPATILFTSGSTGRPKAAWSDHRAVCQAAVNFAAQSWMLFARTRDDLAAVPANESALLCVPLFHVTGEIAVLLQGMLLGRKLVIMPRWNALEAMRLIERERVTFFVGVPLMSYEIATHVARAEHDLSSCRTFAAGGSSCPPSHVGQIRAALPHGFPMQGYGLTESNCVGASNFNENYLAKPHSAGPASSPLIEIAVFGPDGARQPAGEAGEVAIRSICTFRGYWNDPEATARAFRPDGFFLTGDIGYLDADGYLVIVDRKRNIIIRGGENISCAEVEEAIYAFRGVAETCVFAVDDPYFGEVPAAVVVPREGVTVCEDALRAHLAGRLARFKVPARFWQTGDTLPRLGTQKIDRVAVKARYSQEEEAARTAA